MQKDKKQRMRFTDAELETIKVNFAENEELLIAIRKAILGITPTAFESTMLSSLKTNDNLYNLVHKTFIPEITGDEPMNQVIDLWMTVQVDNKDEWVIDALLESRAELISYLKAALSDIRNGTDTKPFNILEQPQGYTRLVTRNTIISHIEMQLNQLFLLAGTKDETAEETIKRLKKDSAK